MPTNHSDHALDRMYDVIDNHGGDNAVVFNAMAEAIMSLKTELDTLWHVMTEASRRAAQQRDMGMMLQGKDIGDLKGHQHGMVDKESGPTQYL